MAEPQNYEAKFGTSHAELLEAKLVADLVEAGAEKIISGGPIDGNGDV